MYIFNRIRNLVSDKYVKIYIFFFSVYCGVLLLSNFTSYDELLKSTMISLLKYVCLFGVLVKIVFRDYLTWMYEEKIKILLFIFLVLLITYFSGNRTFLQYVVFIIGAKDIPFKQIVKYLLFVEVLVCILTIAGSFFSIIPNHLYSRTSSNIVRYSMGFKDYKYFSTLIYSISMYFFYLKQNKHNVFLYVGILSLNTVVFYLTNSRNEFLCIILLLMLNYLHEKNKMKKIIDMITSYTAKYLGVLSFFAIFSLSLIYTGDNTFLKFINTLLSGRLNLARKAISEFGISLFGTHIVWIGQSSLNLGLEEVYNFVDCSYIKILLEYGLLGLCLILSIFWLIVKKQNKTFFIYITVIYFHSILDPHLFTLPFNVFILLFADCFFNKKAELKDGGISLRKLSQEEIQNEEINMLKNIINFLDNHNLTYYLCGGSLLGAIRHKGFIPWDDDIDILMPRPDYEKLIRISETDKLHGDIELYSLSNKKLNDPFCKAVNLNTKMEKHYINDEYDCHLWIDIFPMDGFSGSKKEAKVVYKIVHFLRRLNVMIKVRSEIIELESKTVFRRFYKSVFRVVLSPIRPYWIAKIIDIIAKRYSFHKSEYVGGIAWGYGPQELLKKEIVNNCTVDFEGVKVNTFSCWDKYLTNLYGDYMTLPPEDQRVAHFMDVYIMEEKYE